MKLSEVIENVGSHLRNVLADAGLAVVENPAVAPKTLSNHAFVVVDSISWDPETFGYAGRVVLRFRVITFHGMGQSPLSSLLSVVSGILPKLLLLPDGAVSSRITSIDLGDTGEYYSIEIRGEYEFSAVEAG